MERMHASAGTSLNEVRGWLRTVIRGPGAVCPACEQVAKVYKRKLEGAMTAFLIRAYRVQGTEWFHVPTFMQVDVQARKACGVGGTYSKLAYWGLLEEATEKREDGGRAGWWRVTPLGEQMVLNRATVKQYILIYNARFLGFDGPDVSLQGSLGKKFNYRELMDLTS